MGGEKHYRLIPAPAAAGTNPAALRRCFLFRGVRMATDYKKILLAIAPHGKPAIIDGFAAALPQCCEWAGIVDDVDLAIFIGQVAVESDYFRAVEEYASGKAYEGRKDLGNIHPGDGVKYKGGGLIQITGEENYRKAGIEMGVDLVNHPELLRTFPYAAWAASKYWKDRKVVENLKKGKTFYAKVLIATHIVNGGENGLAAREKLSTTAMIVVKGWKLDGVATAAAEAIADPNAALAKAAAREQTAAKAKMSIAGIASLPAVAASPTAQATTGLPGWAMWAGIALFAGAAIWAFLEIRRHENAAQALTEAAKGT